MTRPSDILVHDLIERLGGPTYVGSKLGMSTQAVGMWSVRGFIPFRHRFAIRKLCNGQILSDEEREAIHS